MNIDNDNAETVVNEDRLSTLPDELIHQILDCFDTKYAVQTCVLSSRWKLIWTTMTNLDFESRYFSSLPKFARFVKHVLTCRNNQIEVTSLNLRFRGAANQVFVREIANYAFAHNVQQLMVISCPKINHEFPSCLFSSSTLKQFTFSSGRFTRCLTPITPWDFPALTTLHLSRITLCDDNTREPVDIFSKCVNLTNLTLKWFNADTRKALNIIAPQLSTLVLMYGRCSERVNLVTPQLGNLTIVNCSFRHLNAPTGLSYFRYRHDYPILFENPLYSLDKVNVFLGVHCSDRPYTKEDARQIVKMLQELHSARFLTLNFDILECIFKYPNLLSRHPSPFSNLVRLSIDSIGRNDTLNFELSTRIRSFFLDKSPTATCVIDLFEKRRLNAITEYGKQSVELKSHMVDLKALLKQGKTTLIEKKHEKEKTKITLENLLEQLPDLIESKEFLIEQMKVCVEQMKDLITQYNACKEAIISKKVHIRGLLQKLPIKITRYFEEHYEFKESEQQCSHLLVEIDSCQKIIDDSENVVSGIMSTLQKDVSAVGPVPPP